MFSLAKQDTNFCSGACQKQLAWRRQQGSLFDQENFRKFEVGCLSVPSLSFFLHLALN